MKKGLKIIIFILVIGTITGWIFMVKTKENELLRNLAGKMIYFYGETCFYCANVEKFFEENNIENKIQFEKREIYKNRRNANLLILLGKRKCELKEKEIGVPFFWDGSKCIIGDQSIIDYFEAKIMNQI